MKNYNIEIKDKITEFLKTRKYGASASEISKSIGHNRITVSKYLEIMKAHQILSYEEIASAKVWHISKKRDKPTVLIVDDEPHVVDLVAISLIPTQYNIVKAYSGFDALDKIYSETPDIVILDLMMPNINGYEVCQKIKENALTQHIPVVILSAKGEIGDKLKGMKIGADDYITKPFDPMELEARVSMVLRRTAKNIDTHPLTKLPGISSAKEKLGELISDQAPFNILNIRLEGLDAFSKKHGAKKADELVILFSRMLKDLHKEAFIAQTVKDSFILMTEEKDPKSRLMDSFERLTAFIPNSKPVALMIKSAAGERIRQRKLSPEQVWNELEVI